MTKKASVTELSRMTISELRKEIQLKRAELAKMRMGLVMQSEKNHALYKLHRKDVARMSMVLVRLEKNGPVKTVSDAPATETAKKVVKEKPSQTAKKSVKRSGSRSKKA